MNYLKKKFQLNNYCFFGSYVYITESLLILDG